MDNEQRLSELAEKARHHMDRAEAFRLEAHERRWAGLLEAYEAGLTLIEVKGLLKHGEWTPWLEANFPKSVQTARKYMELARLYTRDELDDLDEEEFVGPWNAVYRKTGKLSVIPDSVEAGDSANPTPALEPPLPPAEPQILKLNTSGGEARNSPDSEAVQPPATGHVQTVRLTLNQEELTEFEQMETRLSEHFNTDNPTATTLACFRLQCQLLDEDAHPKPVKKQPAAKTRRKTVAS